MTAALVVLGGALVLLVPVLSVVYWRHRDAASRGRATKWAGFALLAAFSLLAGVFTAGEALDEPGGAAGVGLVLSWLVPLCLLVAVAVWAPRWSRWVFVVVTVAVAVGIGWLALDPAARLMEDRVGPVGAVAAFVVAAALGVLGLQRTRLAGWLLIAVGLFPWAMATIGIRVGGQPLLLVGVVALITGILYVISAGLVKPRAGTSDPNQSPAVPVATGGETDAADN